MSTLASFRILVVTSIQHYYDGALFARSIQRYCREEATPFEGKSSPLLSVEASSDYPSYNHWQLGKPQASFLCHSEMVFRAHRPTENRTQIRCRRRPSLKQLNYKRSTEFGNSAQRMYPIMSLLRWIRVELNDFLMVSSYLHVPLSMSKESQFWCQLPCSIAEWYLWFKKKK